MPPNPFSNNNRFTIVLFEAFFVATCEPVYNEKSLIETPLDFSKVTKLSKDSEFYNLSQKGTMKLPNISGRLERARKILK
jgi:hypothetical protein